MTETNIQKIISIMVEPRLQRWAQVVTQEGGYGGRSHGLISGLYATDVQKGTRNGPTYVEFNSQQLEEAKRTSVDISELRPELSKALRTHYLEIGTAVAKADICECSSVTFYNRVNMAKECLYIKWFR